MKIQKIIYLFFILGLFAGEINAQNVTIKGQIRTRGEYRDGSHTLLTEEQKPAAFVNQRSRLILDYKNDRLESRLTLQDARVWGESTIMGDDVSSGIYEAWAKYYFSPNFSLKIGRQELKYDDQRLLSWRNWKSYGASYDIALLQYENLESGVNADLGLGMNNVAESKSQLPYTVAGSPKYLAYLWLSKKINDNFKITLMSIADGNEKATDPSIVYARYTLGPNVTFSTGNFSAYANFYYQTGDLQSGKDIDANFYSGYLSYKLGKVNLMAGYDHYSGTDFSDTENEKSNTFDKLWGAGHKYLGYMDHFSKSPGSQTKGAGLNNLYFRATLGLIKKMKLQATYHYFALDKAYLPNANQLGDPYTEIDKSLGSEVDLMLIYSPSKEIKLWAGYSFALPGETWETVKGIPDGTDSKFPQFAYLMVSFTPTFYKN